MIDAKILHTSQIIVAFSPIRAFMLDTILIIENEIKDKNPILMFIICKLSFYKYWKHDTFLSIKKGTQIENVRIKFSCIT